MQLVQEDIKNTHLYTHACMYIHPEMSALIRFTLSTLCEITESLK